MTHYQFANRSTSTTRLCGDVKLTAAQKIKYLLLNASNNKAQFNGVDRNLKISNYTPKSWRDAAIDETVGDGDAPASPSRFLSNEFWKDFDLDPLVKSNGPIRVLEVGCGTGVYGLLFQRKLGDNLALYRGVDVVEHSSWKNMPAHFEFSVDRAENITTHLSGIDLIVTQSAIEHFEYDLTFFHQVADYVNTSKRNIWQIHLMPCAECLKTYLCHGYRQYTPNSLSQVTSLFRVGTDLSLYRLGGSSANALHLCFITMPNLLLRRDLREHFPKWYGRKLAKAIDSDVCRSNRTDAAFYALVIKSSCAPD
jgi:hypothetical protein